MSKIAATYARVSSERQKEDKTIKSQTAALLEYAKQHAYTVPETWIFEDDGYSGSNLLRPALDKVRDLAAEGRIDIVLIYSPDRLSRKYAYQVLLTEELSRNGVSICFVNSIQARTAEERLLLQFQGMIAEYERAQIMERSRRGKRHKAKSGTISVLSGAPFGYDYIKRTDQSDGHYKINEVEAKTVRYVYQLYTERDKSIGEITQILSAKKILTKKGGVKWDRSTVWAMLRNPAYYGKAAFGKTRKSQRQKVTRPLRLKGGYTSRNSCSQETPKKEWIWIPVPPLVTKSTYEIVQEKLRQNKEKASRNTKEPSILQGMLVCKKCGYSYYRTSTKTSKRKIYYYRCLGSDDYRYPTGRKCGSLPIRQDYIDDLVWNQILALVSDESLVQSEIQKRINKAKNASPIKKKLISLEGELKKTNKCIDRLLDAYQTSLISMTELKNRVEKLRKSQLSLKANIGAYESQRTDNEQYVEMEISIQGFFSTLEKRVESMGILEKQQIMRLLVKDILVDDTEVIINHSIPLSKKNNTMTDKSYLLCGRRHKPNPFQHDFGWA